MSLNNGAHWMLVFPRRQKEKKENPPTDQETNDPWWPLRATPRGWAKAEGLSLNCWNVPFLDPSTGELEKQENMTTQEVSPVASEPGLEAGNAVPTLTVAPSFKKGDKLKVGNQGLLLSQTG